MSKQIIFILCCFWSISAISMDKMKAQIEDYRKAKHAAYIPFKAANPDWQKSNENLKNTQKINKTRMMTLQDLESKQTLEAQAILQNILLDKTRQRDMPDATIAAANRFSLIKIIAIAGFVGFSSYFLVSWLVNLKTKNRMQDELDIFEASV